MKLCLNPDNKYISLDNDNLLISNKENNLILTKSNFAKLKYDISVNNEIDSIFIDSDIVIYTFQEFYLLNKEYKKYPKLLFLELSEKKLDYLKFESVAFILFNKDILFTISYWDLIQIQKSKKINFSYIMKNNYYQTVFTKNLILFFLLKRKNIRCTYVCEKSFLLYKKISVNNLIYLVKDKKKALFSKKVKFVNFEKQKVDTKCSNCNYIHICGGTSYFNKKNCNQIKNIINKSFYKELKK